MVQATSDVPLLRLLLLLYRRAPPARDGVACRHIMPATASNDPRSDARVVAYERPRRGDSARVDLPSVQGARTARPGRHLADDRALGTGRAARKKRVREVHAAADRRRPHSADGGT